MMYDRSLIVFVIATALYGTLILLAFCSASAEAKKTPYSACGVQGTAGERYGYGASPPDYSTDECTWHCALNGTTRRCFCD